MKIQDVKRQGWEQGTMQGLEEGVRGGEMEGPATAVAMEPRGEGTRVMWSLGPKDPNTQGPSKPSGQGCAKARCFYFCYFC